MKPKMSTKPATKPSATGKATCSNAGVIRWCSAALLAVELADVSSMSCPIALIGARRKPFRLAGRRLCDALDGIAVHQAGIDGAADGERNLLSSHLAGFDRRGPLSNFHRPRQHLKLLLQCELAARHFPPALRFPGNDPEIGRAKMFAVIGNLDACIGRPV